MTCSATSTPREKKLEAVCYFCQPCYSLKYVVGRVNEPLTLNHVQLDWLRLRQVADWCLYSYLGHCK